MTTFPGSPRLQRAGIVLLDPSSGAIQRIIVMQYNPNRLTRSLEAQGIGEGGQDRSQALRLKGPPVETYRLEAVIDAADQLEFPDDNQAVVENGILPQLAALEMLVYPASSDLIRNNTLASLGTLEIAPTQAPLSIFVWGAHRVLPVRVTEFSVTEEAFDPRLNPLRATISLGMRVLSVSDLGFDHPGGNLYMTYQQQLENLAQLSQAGSLGKLGISASDLA
jgi:hypothetical protein